MVVGVFVANCSVTLELLHVWVTLGLTAVILTGTGFAGRGSLWRGLGLLRLGLWFGAFSRLGFPWFPSALSPITSTTMTLLRPY